mmetsp:Transcript_25049/g.41935  ORF Transcript_25049/g.41935 Transcript_25049/m.41935 type:complete len:842 (-) Transcript_25049:186-2711(-)
MSRRGRVEPVGSDSTEGVTVQRNTPSYGETSTPSSRLNSAAIGQRARGGALPVASAVISGIRSKDESILGEPSKIAVRLVQSGRRANANPPVAQRGDMVESSARTLSQSAYPNIPGRLAVGNRGENNPAPLGLDSWDTMYNTASTTEHTEPSYNPFELTKGHKKRESVVVDARRGSRFAPSEEAAVSQSDGLSPARAGRRAGVVKNLESPAPLLPLLAVKHTPVPDTASREPTSAPDYEPLELAKGKRVIYGEPAKDTAANSDTQSLNPSSGQRKLSTLETDTRVDANPVGASYFPTRRAELLEPTTSLNPSSSGQTKLSTLENDTRADYDNPVAASYLASKIAESVEPTPVTPALPPTPALGVGNSLPLVSPAVLYDARISREILSDDGHTCENSEARELPPRSAASLAVLRCETVQPALKSGVSPLRSGVSPPPFTTPKRPRTPAQGFIHVARQDPYSSKPSTPSCRICFGDHTDGEPLIPLGCACKGDLARVHEECLMRWFDTSGKKYCELCNAPVELLKRLKTPSPQPLVYHLPPNTPWYRMTDVVSYLLSCGGCCVTFTVVFLGFAAVVFASDIWPSSSERSSLIVKLLLPLWFVIGLIAFYVMVKRLLVIWYGHILTEALQAQQQQNPAGGQWDHSEGAPRATEWMSNSGSDDDDLDRADGRTDTLMSPADDNDDDDDDDDETLNSSNGEDESDLSPSRRPQPPSRAQSRGWSRGESRGRSRGRSRGVAGSSALEAREAQPRVSAIMRSMDSANWAQSSSSSDDVDDNDHDTSLSRPGGQTAAPPEPAQVAVTIPDGEPTILPRGRQREATIESGPSSQPEGSSAFPEEIRDSGF